MAGDVKKSVQIAINLVNGVGKQVGGIVSSFGKLTEGINKATKAVNGLNAKLGKIKTPSNIKSLGTDLRSISKVDGKGISTLSTSLAKLGKISLPSFKAVNADLAQHANRLRLVIKAYNDLATASKGVNLKGVGTSAKQASGKIKGLDNTTKRSKASFSQWGYALGSASTGLSKFGTKMYGVTRGFSAVSKEMGVAMAAFTAVFSAMFGIKAVVTDLVEFDDAIRSAGAVAQASSVGLEAFSNAARSMGESTRYTAKDAAEALKALAMTGLEVNEAIATLPTVLNLAAAANMGLGESADIVTNIMVGYKKEVSDLPHISDLMTAAFTNSNTSLQELGVAMKYVGPVARASGQSIEETTGILASLANAGYRGSKAGTTLRTSFARLLAPTKKMSATLGHYGIALSDLTEKNGDLKSFTSILDIMSKKSITAGDALTIFGKRAGPGILSLIGQGIPAIEEMNAKIAESEGTALKAAYEMEAGLGGALRKLKSMWQELSISIGKVIEQDVQSFIESLTKSLKENKDSITKVVVSFFELVGVFAKVAGWLANLVASHVELTSAILGTVAVMKIMNSALYATVATKALAFFTSLATGVAWSSIASGIAGVNASLARYLIIMNAGKGSLLLKTMFGGIGSIKFAGAAKGIKAVGMALLTFGRLAKAAVLASGPVGIALVTLTTVAMGAYSAFKMFNKSHADVIASSTKIAKASQEVNRELEYQLAELNLINKEYDRDSTKDFSDAQDRLSDILDKANIPLEDRIDYLTRSNKGADEAKKVIDELTKSINKEKSANDSKIIKETTTARQEQADAVEEQAKKIEMYYGVQVDGVTRLSKAEKGMQFTNMISPVTWMKKYAGALEDNVEEYKKLKKEQKLSEGGYKTMIAQMIIGKRTAEEFAEALKKSSASQETIDDATEAFARMSEKVKDNKEELEKLAKLSKSAVDAEEALASRQLANAKTKSKELDSIASQTQYNLALLEAKGEITHEEAEMAKLQASHQA